MGLFTKVPEKTIQEYVEEARKRGNVRFLDVRTPEEFRDGHLEGSLNLPLHELKKVEEILPEKTEPIYVYCLSGARSKRAAALMEYMGYTDVTNIGGILGMDVTLVK